MQAGSTCQIWKLRNGTVLVKTRDAKQADALQQMEKISDIQININAHKTLNHRKGVVRCRELTYCTEEEIVEELKKQGVVGGATYWLEWILVTIEAPILLFLHFIARAHQST